MGVFADPADPCNTGKLPLQHRTRIHKGLSFHASIAHPSNGVEQGLELILHNPMVIISPCVTGNPALRIRRRYRAGKGGMIIHSNRNNGHRPGHQPMGVAAHLLGPRHIFHLSREALPQPLRERLLVRRKLYRGDSDQLKTQSLSLCFDSKRKRVFILRYHRAPALARIIHCQANDQGTSPPDRRQWAYTLRRPANLSSGADTC